MGRSLRPSRRRWSGLRPRPGDGDAPSKDSGNWERGRLLGELGLRERPGEERGPRGRSRPARLVLRASWPLRNAVAVFSICGQGVSETEGRSVIRTTICRRAGGGEPRTTPGALCQVDSSSTTHSVRVAHAALTLRGRRGPSPSPVSTEAREGARALAAHEVRTAGPRVPGSPARGLCQHVLPERGLARGASRARWGPADAPQPRGLPGARFLPDEKRPGPCVASPPCRWLASRS